MSVFTDSGNKHDRFSLTMHPATLKALSEGMDFAGCKGISLQCETG